MKEILDPVLIRIFIGWGLPSHPRDLLVKLYFKESTEFSYTGSRALREISIRFVDNS